MEMTSHCEYDFSKRGKLLTFQGCVRSPNSWGGQKAVPDRTVSSLRRISNTDIQRC